MLTAIDPATTAGAISRGPATCFRCGRAPAACSCAPGRPRPSVDLARIAGLYPAGVICEIMNEDGTMARVPQLAKFAKRHGLLMITIADLINYRMRTESLVKRAASAKMPTDFGDFRVHAFENQVDSQTHVALVRGDIGDGRDVLVRVHSSCLTGDVLHSIRCDCGTQLDAAMEQIAAEGPRHPAVSEPGRPRHRAREQDPRLRAAGRRLRHGRGERAARVQGRSARLRHRRPDPPRPRRPVDAPAEQQPAKLVGIEGYGLSVSEWLPLEIPAQDSTRRYLKTKKEKMGHKLSSV